MKKIFCLILVLHSFQSYAGETKKGFGFQPSNYTDLVEHYRQSGATSFDSFHHEYLMMMWNGFPNLKLDTKEAKNVELKQSELLNPQNLINVDDLNSTPAISAKTKLSEQDQVTTLKKVQALRAVGIAKTIDESSYKKEGYYKYYKKYFAISVPNAEAKICVRLNLDQIDDGALESGFKVLFKEVYTPILGPDETKEKFSFRECFGLSVNEQELDYLNASISVKQFYPPELYLLDPRSPRKGR